MALRATRLSRAVFFLRLVYGYASAEYHGKLSGSVADLCTGVLVFGVLLPLRLLSS